MLDLVVQLQTFHLGYPKAASTTIQNLLLADPGLNVLGKPYKSADAEFHVRERLAFADLRQLPLHELTQMRREICTGEPIVSDEILSGVGFAHGIAANSLLQIIDNLDLLTEGQFVAHVVLRQPEEFIRSYYNQLVRMGARMTFDQFCSLVLLRRHHWVYRSLDYGSILRSKAYRTGQLKVVLFETLMKERQLGTFMRDAFGASHLPDDPTAVQANSSETDSVIDYIAPRLPLNPPAWIELPITQPSIQEYDWAERMAPELGGIFLSTWSAEYAEAVRIGHEYVEMLESARRRLGGHRGRRPMTAMLRRLLDAISETNRGVDEEFPLFGFARHHYFD